MTRFPAARSATLLLMLLAVTVLGWVGGPDNGVDRAIVLQWAAVRAASPDLAAMAIALTWLGSAYATLGAAAAVALLRLARRRSLEALWLAATVGGGRLVAEALKLAVDRPRPALFPYPVPVSSMSFPSGHATNSLLAFGALALLLAPRRWKIAALIAAFVLSIAIGMTRPFLGVHWPSDVLAGWLLGGALLLVAAPFRPSVSRTEA